MHLPYFENVLFSDFIKARKSGKELLPVVYSFEEKNKYFQYAFEHSDFRIISEELKKWILEQPYFGYSVAIQKHSAIFFNDYTGKLFSVEENDILIRFAKVFDQAYTRFLDLQKAEIQTREAEIQLAMERVRARTMAMQKSDELPEAANLLFQQVKSLGLPAWSAGYCLWEDKRKAITLWMSSEDVIQQSFKIPTTDEWTFIKFREAYEKGELFVAFDIGGKEIIEHYNYLKKLPGIQTH